MEEASFFPLRKVQYFAKKELQLGKEECAKLIVFDDQDQERAIERVLESLPKLFSGKGNFARANEGKARKG